ncbi:MAG: MBL fold metallo-hydrolase [Dehalococcoidia bacterium]|nr:MBL fold metallo-hydrolase [Dehalococcoidia bacterium]
MLATIQYEQVTQIKLCRYPDFSPHATVCAYLVDGLLIDSGPAYTAEELTEFLKDKGLKMVVNTHYHEDHIAANALLKERYGAELLAHPLAVDKINRPAKLYPYQVDVWGYPVPSQVKEIGDSVITENFLFEVISTPGHDRDHICLFERNQGWLFSGDLFVGTHPNVVRPMDDIWQIIADLKKVKGLTPRFLFPAPGKVIAEPVPVLEQTIQYLEELGQKVTELHDKGLSPAEIMQQIFGNEAPIADLTQQQFSSINMVKSFLKTG